MRWGLWLLVAIWAGLACAHVPRALPPSSTPPDRPTLLIYPALSAQLYTLTQALAREIALCLHGWRSPEIHVATHYTMTRHAEISPRRVVAVSCPDTTLAHWHVHPAAGSCTLSPTDAETARDLGYEWMVVSTGDLMCWWHASELPTERPPWSLMPDSGQVVRVEHELVVQ